MISGEKYLDFINHLSASLSYKRFCHSVSVENECRLLAHRYGADDNKALLAGLLHDVTREHSLAEQLTLADKYGIITDGLQRSSANLMHALTAPAVMQDAFGICDKDVLDAVRYHTTGKPHMSLLCKILFIADFCEPTRPYDFAPTVRKLAYEDIDRAVLQALELSVNHLKQKGTPIHCDTLNAFAFYSKEKNLKI